MNRLFLAVVAATVAAGLTYAVVIGTAMSRTTSAVVPLWMLVLPGVLWGAAFAGAILLPLWLLMRRRINGLWLQFGLPAIALWAVTSIALFGSRGLSSYEALGNAVMVLPAGIAAVVAFILVFRGKPYA